MILILATSLRPSGFGFSIHSIIRNFLI